MQGFKKLIEYIIMSQYRTKIKKIILTMLKSKVLSVFPINIKDQIYHRGIEITKL